MFVNSLPSIKNLNLFVSIYVENESISSLSSDSTIIKDSNSNTHVYEHGHEYCGVTSPINRIYLLWGASPSRFIGSSPSVGRTNQGLDLVVVIASPTSARVPSHIWFISFWSDHMCTTTTSCPHSVTSR